MTESTHDHPGPEWYECSPGVFYHLILKETVCSDKKALFRENYDVWMLDTRDEAIARCRAISAAALAWEVKKREALAAALCEREEI